MPTPSAPEGLTVSSFSSSEVVLDWTEETPSDTYNVYRSEAELGGFGEYVPINDDPINDPNWIDIEGEEGKTYIYRVTRIVGVDESGFSKGVSGCFVDASERINSYQEADLDAIFNGEQGIDATYTRFGFPPISIRIIYDNSTLQIQEVGGKSKTQKVQAEAKIRETLYASNKDILQISGITYKIKNTRPNHSVGINILEISKVGVNG